MYTPSLKVEVNNCYSDLIPLLPFATEIIVRPLFVTIGSDTNDAVIPAEEGHHNCFGVILLVDQEAAKTAGQDTTGEEWLADCQEKPVAQFLAGMLWTFFQAGKIVSRPMPPSMHGVMLELKTSYDNKGHIYGVGKGFEERLTLAFHDLEFYGPADK